MNFFHSFHNRGMFEKSLNTTFISRIPKIVGAVELKDFRSISIRNVYKILVVQM